MKLLTFLPLEEIAEYEKLSGSALNQAKEKLAFEVTKLIHGQGEAEKAQAAAKSLFSGAGAGGSVPATVLAEGDFAGSAIDIVTALVKTGLAKSRGEARRLVDQGGVFADDEKVGSIAFSIPREALEKAPVMLRKGKKGFHQISVSVKSGL
jgi:tyrosyl-tRNA synthetase